MLPAMALIMVAVVAVLFWIGLRRIELLRTPGLEGIEDPQIARAYGRFSRWPQFRLLRHLIAQKVAHYHPTGILADVGCGPGYLTTLIAQQNRHLVVLGIDAADEMIRVAGARALRLGLSDRVAFRRGDVGSLPLPDDGLDFAVSTLSLHHWSHPAQGLAEIHRVLKPGGQILLFDLRRDSRRLFLWLLRFAQGIVVPAALRYANEPLGSLQASYSLTELDRLLAESQFKEYRIEGGAGWVFVWARKALAEMA